jgi:hypothetical protein
MSDLPILPPIAEIEPVRWREIVGELHAALILADRVRRLDGAGILALITSDLGGDSGAAIGRLIETADLLERLQHHLHIAVARLLMPTRTGS